MTNPFGALTIAPRAGTEPFHRAGESLGFDVAGFWRWAASDLTSNVWRGVLAEYLLFAQALGLDVESIVRTEWDACDLRTPDGIRVEVKSAAYLQSWHQPGLSKIKFGIALKRGWHARTNVSEPVPCRSADVYVFALLGHRDKSTLDPLDLNQWQFFVASARALDATFAAQKEIALSTLQRVTPTPVSFSGLREAVMTVARIAGAGV